MFGSCLCYFFRLSTVYISLGLGLSVLMFVSLNKNEIGTKMKLGQQQVILDEAEITKYNKTNGIQMGPIDC